MRIVEVWLGDQRCALPIEAVDEILPLVEARPLTGVPSWVLGLAHLRGTFVPILDATELASGTPTARSMNARVILLQTGACGGMRLALLVSRVGSIYTVDFESDRAHPGIVGAGRGILSTITADDAGEISLLNPAALLTDEYRRLFRDAGCAA